MVQEFLVLYEFLVKNSVQFVWWQCELPIFLMKHLMLAVRCYEERVVSSVEGVQFADYGNDLGSNLLVPDTMDSTGIVDELIYNMEDSLLELDAASSAEDLLLVSQHRHKIFHGDFVIKTSYETKKAHRGQVRANGDPYLKQCVEAAVLLAFIGANSSVDAAELLHDTLDDSFATYEHIFQMFCAAGVADLVQGYIKMK